MWLYEKILFILWGVLRSLWILLIWLIKGILIWNVKVGGWVGFGKLVFEKGLVLFKYCILFVKVVIFLIWLLIFNILIFDLCIFMWCL